MVLSLSHAAPSSCGQFICQPGEPCVNCFVNPCDVGGNDACGPLECVPNYCGGCNYECQ